MNNKPLLSAIVAVGKKNEIGVGDTLPWRISSELAHFKKVTDGKVLIVGRKTYETLPLKLPNRTLIVVTRNTEYHKYLPEDVYSAQNIDEAVALAASLTTDEVIVIGGATIYAQVADKIKKLYLTVVNLTIPEATAYFPREEYQSFFYRAELLHSNDVRENKQRNEPSYTIYVYSKRTTL